MWPNPSAGPRWWATSPMAKAKMSACSPSRSATVKPRRNNLEDFPRCRWGSATGRGKSKSPRCSGEHRGGTFFSIITEMNCHPHPEISKNRNRRSVFEALRRFFKWSRLLLACTPPLDYTEMARGAQSASGSFPEFSGFTIQSSGSAIAPSGLTKHSSGFTTQATDSTTQSSSCTPEKSSPTLQSSGLTKPLSDSTPPLRGFTPEKSSPTLEKSDFTIEKSSFALKNSSSVAEAAVHFVYQHD